MKTSRMNRPEIELKDEVQKEREEIANEKEELHEIFDFLTTQKKNNNKKSANGDTS